MPKDEEGVIKYKVYEPDNKTEASPFKFKVLVLQFETQTQTQARLMKENKFIVVGKHLIKKNFKSEMIDIY